MGSSTETALAAEPINGEKLYQQRARQALPILVRQAHACVPITYESLATEIDMPNPRNLNYVLGSIGQTLKTLSEEWQIDVPPIQCLVVNKNSGLPGIGVDGFLGEGVDYKQLSKEQRRRVVDGYLARVYAFSEWNTVLEYLSLKAAEGITGRYVELAANHGFGGEGEAHRILKEFVARNPEVLGLSKTTGPGITEYALPSGDFVDVVYAVRDEVVCAEVKPVTSSVSDVTRGLFQCVKYKAVMKAVTAVNGGRDHVRSVLVLGGALPAELVSLKNILGVDVVEKVNPNCD